MSVDRSGSFKLDASFFNRSKSQLSKTATRFANLTKLGSASTPMYSVAKLNSIKSNPSNLNLDFSEIVTTLHPTTTPQYFLPRPRISIGSVSSSKRGTDHSLGSVSSPAKIRREKSLTDGKRQIIVEKYLKSAMNPSPTKKNLDLIWHQTLKEPKYEDYVDSPPPRKMTLSVEKNSRTSGTMTPSHRRNRSLERSCSHRIMDFSSFHTKAPLDTAANSNQVSLIRELPERGNFKHIDRFCDAIRDFQKMLEHMQKTKVNFLREQEHLHEFVLTFVKEFDIIAKTPTKGANRARLTSFQQAIEGKVASLKSVQDLLYDQTKKIQRLCQKRGSVVLRSRMLSLVSALDETTAEIPLLSALEKKREKVKEEVQMLQLERRESEIKSRRSHPGSPLLHSPAASPSRRQTSKGPIKAKDMFVQISKRSHPDSPLLRSPAASPSRRQTSKGPINAKDMFVQIPKRSHPDSPLLQSPAASPSRRLTSKGTTKVKEASDQQLTFTELAGEASKSRHESKRNTDPKPEIEGSLANLDKPREPPLRSLLELNQIVREESDNEKSRDSIKTAVKKVDHKEMQMFFTSAIGKLEEKLKSVLSEVKVFQAKSLLSGKESSETGSNRVLSAYIQNRIDTINELCDRLLRVQENKRGTFLTSLNGYFAEIEEIIASNLLKISSLCHLLSALIEKLFDAFEFKNNFSQFEMGDKEIRRTYTSGFLQRKNELDQLRESVLFIAQQIAQTLPQIEQGAELHENYLANLSDRVKQLSRGMRYLARFPELDSEFENNLLAATTISKKLATATENLEGAFESDEFANAQAFESLIQCLKEAASISKKLDETMKEFEYYSKFHAFTSVLEGPIRILTEVRDEFRAQEKRSKQVLEKSRERVTIQYNGLVAETEAIEAKFNYFTAEILVNNKKYLDFDSSQDFQHKLTEFRELMDDPKTKIEYLLTQSYPSSIVFLPRPIEKMKFIATFEEKVSAIHELLGVGELLSSTPLATLFHEATSKNLLDKVTALRDSIKTETRRIELIAGSPIISTESGYQTAAHKILTILMKLKTMLTKLVDYVGKVNKAYSKLRSPTDTSSTTGPSELQKLLSTLEQLHGELYASIEEFFSVHKVFARLGESVRDIHRTESKILKNISENMEKVNQNIELFVLDIVPVTKLDRFLDLLTEWPEVAHYCKTEYDQAQPIVEYLSQIKENIFFRPELRRSVDDFELKQRRILSSLDVCVAFFELGKVFNSDTLARVLTPQIKEDNSLLVSFIFDLEEATEKMDIKTGISRKQVGNEFEEFMLASIGFLKQMHRYLLDVREKYCNLSKNLEATAEKNKMNIVEALRDCCLMIKGMHSDSIAKLNEFPKDFPEKPKVLVVIEQFLKDVVEKDLNVFEKLFNETKKMSDFIKAVKTDFLMEELQSLHYRKLSMLEHETLQLRRDKADEYFQHLNVYLNTPEISKKNTIRGFIVDLRNIFRELRQIFETFRVYYKDGREIYNMLDEFLSIERSNEDITKRLTIINQKVEEMMLLIRNSEKTEKSESALDDDFGKVNAQAILDKDILGYFQGLQGWIKHLLGRASIMVEFEKELEKYYSKEVVWLKDEYSEFLRKWRLDDIAVFPRERGRASENDFEGLWGRIYAFEEVLYHRRISVRDELLAKIADDVEYMNQAFLNEWFFKGDSPEYADKVYPKIIRLADKMREKRIKKLSMIGRMSKYYEVIDKVLQIVADLDGKEMLSAFGFKAVHELETIESHLTILDFEHWRALMSLLLAEGEQLVNGTDAETSFLKEVESRIGFKLFGKMIPMTIGFRNVLLDL